jgi:tetraspanin-18
VNILFVCIAVLIIIAGVWLALHATSLADFVRWIGIGDRMSEFKQAYIMLIVFGVIVFMISFAGFYGACYDSRKFLIFYGVFLVIIVLLEIAIAIMAVAFATQFDSNVRSSLRSSIKNYYAADKNAITAMWDWSMASLKCCGADGYEDFKASKEWAKASKQVPEACCVLEDNTKTLQPKDKGCPQSPSDSNSYWKKGCYKRLTERMWESKILTIALAVSLALLEVLGILAAFYLWRAIRRNERFY